MLHMVLRLFACLLVAASASWPPPGARLVVQALYSDASCGSEFVTMRKVDGPEGRCILANLGASSGSMKFVVSENTSFWNVYFSGDCQGQGSKVGVETTLNECTSVGPNTWEKNTVDSSHWCQDYPGHIMASKGDQGCEEGESIVLNFCYVGLVAGSGQSAKWYLEEEQLKVAVYTDTNCTQRNTTGDLYPSVVNSTCSHVADMGYFKYEASESHGCEGTTTTTSASVSAGASARQPKAMPWLAMGVALGASVVGTMVSSSVVLWRSA